MKKYLLIFLFSLLPSLALAAPSYLYYSGDGSVADGRTETISSLDGYDFFVLYWSNRNTIDIWINDDETNPDVFSRRYFRLSLSAPSGADLQIGNYENATRWPFQAFDSPGLDFSADGPSNNQLTGSFRILDIGFDGDILATLAVDFVQNDENGYAGQTYGSLRYNSTIPLNKGRPNTVPEPSPLALLVTAAGAALTLRRRQV